MKYKGNGTTPLEIALYEFICLIYNTPYSERENLINGLQTIADRYKIEEPQPEPIILQATDTQSPPSEIQPQSADTLQSAAMAQSAARVAGADVNLDLGGEPKPRIAD